MTVTGQQVTAAICLYLARYEACEPSTWGAVEDYARRGRVRVQASPGSGTDFDPLPFADLCWQEVAVLRAIYTPAKPPVEYVGRDKQTGEPIPKKRRTYEWEAAKELGVTSEQVRRILSIARGKVRAALERAQATEERNHRLKCE